MKEFIIALLLSEALVLILIQTLRITFVLSDKIKIILDYSFFSLELTKDNEKNQGKAKNSRPKKAKTNITPSVFKLLRQFLKRTKITIKEITVVTDKFDIAKSSFLYGLFFALTAPISHTHKIIPNHLCITDDVQASSIILIVAECSLFQAIIIFSLFILDLIKRRIKVSNVRKRAK